MGPLWVKKQNVSARDGSVKTVIVDLQGFLRRPCGLDGRLLSRNLTPTHSSFYPCNHRSGDRIAYATSSSTDPARQPITGT